MAGTREIALGIASALGSEHAPQPFPLSFQGQSLEEAATIILLIATDCLDANVPLELIELDPDLYGEVRSRASVELPIRSNGDLQGEARFWRPNGRAGKTS